MIFKIIFNAIITVIILIGCSASIEDPVPPRPTPIVTDTDKCVLAERHLTKLCNTDPYNNSYCCDVVAPTKKGKSYTQFCQEKQDQGVWLNPKCVSTVSSCDQIDVCTHSK